VSPRLNTLAYRATIGSAPPTATRSGIDASQRKAVLVRIAWAAQDDGSQIIIGAKTIARQCEMSIRQVRYVLDSLVHDGILLRVRDGGGRGRTTEYAIDVARLAQLAGEPGKSAPSAPIRPTAKGAPGARLRSRNSAPNARNSAPSAQKGAPGAPDRHDRHIDTAHRRACALDARAPAASDPVPIGDLIRDVAVPELRKALALAHERMSASREDAGRGRDESAAGDSSDD
jgi:hypothetical protein